MIHMEASKNLRAKRGYSQLEGQQTAEKLAHND